MSCWYIALLYNHQCFHSGDFREWSNVPYHHTVVFWIHITYIWKWWRSIHTFLQKTIWGIVTSSVSHCTFNNKTMYFNNKILLQNINAYFVWIHNFQIFEYFYHVFRRVQIIKNLSRFWVQIKDKVTLSL